MAWSNPFHYIVENGPMLDTYERADSILDKLYVAILDKLMSGLLDKLYVG